MASTKKKKKNNNRYEAEQKEKLSAGDFFIGFGKWEMTVFGMGLLLVVLAGFMLIAFVSYLFTGQSDYSLLEQTVDPFNEKLQYKNACGSWGAIVAYFFINDLFGLASFLIPPYLMIVGMRMMKIFKFTLLRKFILFTFLMIWLSVFLAAFGTMVPWLGDTFLNIGGNHGVRVVNYMTRVVGYPGLVAVLLLYAVAYLVYLSARTIEIIRNALRVNFLRKVDAERMRSLMLRKNMEHFDNAGSKPAADAETDGDNDADAAMGLNAVADSDDNGTTGDTGTGVIDLTPKPSAAETPQPAEAQSGSGMAIEVKQTDMGDGDIKRGDITTPYDPKLDLEHYKYPTLNLLRKADNATPLIDMMEQNANKDRIIHVLKNFGVEITSIKATIGPTITLYEIVPAEGTRISRIRNLEDDIALSLAAEGIRIIAPIPGKGTIGIEVPNKKKMFQKQTYTKLLFSRYFVD